MSLVEKHLIPALDKVGTDYERGVAFLPQLLGAAQAAQAVFSVIRDSLAAKGGEPVKKGELANQYRLTWADAAGTATTCWI